jgi:hypothetical protein
MQNWLLRRRISWMLSINIVACMQRSQMRVIPRAAHLQEDYIVCCARVSRIPLRCIRATTTTETASLSPTTHSAHAPKNAAYVLTTLALN